MLFPLGDDNPRSTFPWVTIGLIGINALVQLYQSTMSPERAAIFLQAAGAIPNEITKLTDMVLLPNYPQAVVPIPLTLLSSLFVHPGWIPLASNMWCLWLLGDNVEDCLGHLRFALFFLLCGLAGALVQIATDPNSLVPVIGASGAIAGVLGGVALQYPKTRMLCLLFCGLTVRVVELHVFFVIGLWLALQLVSCFADQTIYFGSCFSLWGGIGAGLVLIRLFVKRGIFSGPPSLAGPPSGPLPGNDKSFS